MHLAQFNIARLHQPLEHVDNAEFVASLAAINQLAEASQGFVWRLQDESGLSASYVQVYDDPLIIVNMSVWESADALKHFVYRSGHSAYLRRKREWFSQWDTELIVCWWIPEGSRPDPHDGRRRLEHLNANGPSTIGFRLSEPLHSPTN
jgi:Domain of unknown function (DUF3291)